MWVWEYETEEGAHDLYMDIGEEVRFRVVDESFMDTSPTGPSSAEAASSSEELPKKEAPYTLMVSCPDGTWGQEDPAGGGAVPAMASWVHPSWGAVSAGQGSSGPCGGVIKLPRCWGGRASQAPGHERTAGDAPC